MTTKKKTVKTVDYSKPPRQITAAERKVMSTVLALARAQRRYNEFKAKNPSKAKKGR